MDSGAVDAGAWKIERVGILSTGSEILQGQYADSNAQYLAERLTLAGVTVVAIMAAPDSEDAIGEAFRWMKERADLVICTGGLGPTKDDVNRFVVERVWQRRLVRDEQAIESMARRFAVRGRGALPASNEVQALLPEGATVFYNEWGTAPGFFIVPQIANGETCGLMALPGPPVEMKPMFEKLGFLAMQDYLDTTRVGVVRTIHTFGHPESEVGALVEDLFKPDPNVEFTILAKRHGIDLRICATGNSADVAEQHVERYEKLVRARVPEAMIYGVDEDTLAGCVGKLLKDRGLWVTTAESCTGGLIAEMLTAVSGSSAYVGECHVTYSNDAKMRVLGVMESTVERHGAVSEETAREMALGAVRVSGADYGVAVTGIAGPGGGTAEKPVGLTYIGVAGPGIVGGVVVKRFRFMMDRESNRVQAAQYGLDMLRKILLGVESSGGFFT